MKDFIKNFLLIVLFIMISCNNDERIIHLLNSNMKDDIILGSKKAGQSGNRKFVPLLLKNANDLRTSTNFNFKGVSVYKAKMEALENIYKVSPPKKITNYCDSTIVNFYYQLYKDSK